LTKSWITKAIPPPPTFAARTQDVAECRSEAGNHRWLRVEGVAKIKGPESAETREEIWAQTRAPGEAVVATRKKAQITRQAWAVSTTDRSPMRATIDGIKGARGMVIAGNHSAIRRKSLYTHPANKQYKTVITVKL